MDDQGTNREGSVTAANTLSRFVGVVRACKVLPDDVRECADQAVGIEESTFDQTYIDFLDELILLGARGLEWTARLRKRCEALRSYCGRPLLRGVFVRRMWKLGFALMRR